METQQGAGGRTAPAGEGLVGTSLESPCRSSLRAQRRWQRSRVSWGSSGRDLAPSQLASVSPFIQGGPCCVPNRQCTVLRTPSSSSEEHPQEPAARSCARSCVRCHEVTFESGLREGVELAFQEPVNLNGRVGDTLYLRQHSVLAGDDLRAYRFFSRVLSVPVPSLFPGLSR